MKLIKHADVCLCNLDDEHIYMPMNTTARERYSMQCSAAQSYPYLSNLISLSLQSQEVEIQPDSTTYFQSQPDSTTYLPFQTVRVFWRVEMIGYI